MERQKTRSLWKIFELRVTLIMLCLTLALGVSFYILVYTQFYRLTIDTLQKDARALHHYVEEIISEKSFTELNTREDETKAIYLSAYKQMDQIRRIANIRYLYTAKRDASGTYIYVLDGLDRDAGDFRHVGMPIEKEIIPDLEKCLNGRSVLDDDIKVTDWGIVYVTYFPFHGDDGSIIGAIGMEFDVEDHYRSYHAIRLYTVLISLFLVILFSSATALILRKVFRATEDELIKKTMLLRASNTVATLLLATDAEDFRSTIHEALQILGESVVADRAWLWKNVHRDGGVFGAEIGRWAADPGDVPGETPSAADIPYDDWIPDWRRTLGKGLAVTDPAALRGGITARPGLDDARAVLLTPVFLHGEFWGLIAVAAHARGGYGKNEEETMRAGGILIASAMLRNDMTEKLIAAKEDALNSSKAKSEFLSRMSHDVRTPMNAIIGMTAIAGTHLHDRDRVSDCLEKITVSSKLLLGLINEVLDMSRLESGRISITEEAFSLNELLRNLVTIMQPSIAAKRHTFTVHARAIRHENILGDLQYIQRVFLNILSNAVKYTPDQGEILFEIRENPSETSGYGSYEFTFRDNGYGMKPEFLEKLFTPFERADDAAIRAVQGTGLGMAICRNILHMMHGDIAVRSTYGEGSTFTVTLRLKLQEGGGADAPLPAGLPVLVVDDDRIACETACWYLDRLGLKSRWALSGDEALREVLCAREAGEDFAVVIIDLDMPGMDGVATARRIRETAGAGEPVLLIAAYDWREHEDLALAAGVSGFIAKPVLQSSLACAIKRYALREACPPSPEAVRQRRSYGRKRLLLVEDNEINLEIAVEILGQTGVAVETAENGRVAVAKFAASPEAYYDLIFMDLQMPVMGGLEAAREIRRLAREDARTVPIVAMTANALAEDVAATTAAGMNGHLSKPLEIERLHQLLHHYLGG